MEDDNDNKIVQHEPGEHHEFKYNFINTPWDDRSRKSKAGIIILLIAIFAATMACVIQNFVNHFSTQHSKHKSINTECNLVKMVELIYAARIHSVKTQELVCVGAVLSLNSVLANGICVMSGPIRLRMGSLSDPRCKKGFSVDIIEQVNHDAVISKHVVLLSSYENMAECAHNSIKIGTSLNWDMTTYIIGRPMRGGRALSRKSANLVDINTIPGFTIKNVNLNNTICVMDLGTCPVRAGDLLVQNGKLFGLASTSTHVSDKSKVTCFADVRIVLDILKKLDPDIIL